MYERNGLRIGGLYGRPHPSAILLVIVKSLNSGRDAFRTLRVAGSEML
jgi:hypothetical protein